VEDENGLARRCADGAVMQAYFGEDFAGMELEITRDPACFLRSREIGGEAEEWGEEQYQRDAGLHCCLPEVRFLVPLV